MINDFIENLNNYSILEIQQGFVHNKVTNSFDCLVCGESFEKGQVYPMEKGFFKARKACAVHLATAHPDFFDLLLEQAQNAGSFSEIQGRIIALAARGQKDQEIARELGGKSPSTIRNHRFQMRAKEKEAKLFLAVMAALNQRSIKMPEFIQFHPNLPVHDSRIQITKEEEEATLEKHFSETPTLKMNKFPKKQKQKLIALKRIAAEFDTGKIYSEKEINNRLIEIFDDYVTVRRYLIEYAFLKRKPDGSEYWKEN